MQGHAFNELSNHFPLSFSLKIGTERTRQADATYRKAYKWNENFKNEFQNVLLNDIYLLNNVLDENLNIDETVLLFSNYITMRANSFFEKNIQLNYENVFTSANYKERQIWYNDSCKEKKEKLHDALREYNCLKNEENRNKLFECKKTTTIFVDNVNKHFYSKEVEK